MESGSTWHGAAVSMFERVASCCGADVDKWRRAAFAPTFVLAQEGSSPPRHWLSRLFPVKSTVTPAGTQR